MIRVNIEMVPQGDEDRAYPVAVIEIENEGPQTLRNARRGDYLARLSRISRRPTESHSAHWIHEARVDDFPRSLSVYDLLYRVLREAVGSRNAVPQAAVTKARDTRPARRPLARSGTV